jgi:hypothetical protein
MWSQCSGTRDPAAYKKRHQLATPSSIDQDFNFITQVERSMLRAGDHLQDRGIIGNEDTRKRIKGEARRDVEIHQRVGRILKAPSGLSRALQNKTKWDNRQSSLVWTVEWVLGDNTKVLGNCRGSRTVAEAFTNAVGDRKWNKAKRHYSNLSHLAQSLGSDIEAGTQTAIASDSAIAGVERASDSQIASPNFYLHHPNLPSGINCLIPLQAETTIDDAIRGRVLIEFPTIFALSVPKEQLQKPFITEEVYLEEQYPSERLAVRNEGSFRVGGASTAREDSLKCDTAEAIIEPVEIQQADGKQGS